MNRDHDVMQLRRELKHIRRYNGTLTVVVLVLLVGAFRPTRLERFTEISVERINIVETDGRKSMIIANTARTPGPVIKGRETSKDLSFGRMGTAGMIFLDHYESEIGGLLFRHVPTDRGPLASSGVMFDQRNQDQVVGLEYSEFEGTRSAGLNVWDRPEDVPISDVIALLEARRTATGSARDSIQRELNSLNARRAFGTHRVFLGSAQQMAGLRLRDQSGRERIRLVVDSLNTPRLQFFDEQGRLLQQIPNDR